MQETNSLILSEEDVEIILSRIGWKPLIEAIEETFREEALGNTISPPKTIMHIEAHSNDYRVMPSYMKRYPNYCGCKIVCACPENPKKGLPLVMGHYMLNDARTQELLMIAGARSLTAWRTAAATAVAVRKLSSLGQASVKPPTLGIIGCGLQAYYHVLAICSVTNVGEILLADLDVSRAEALKNRLVESVPHWFQAKRWIRVSNKSGIFFSSDIIVTLTPSTTPHVFETDIPGRPLVIATVGGDSNRKIELDPWILPLTDFYCDSYEQVMHTGLMEAALNQEIVTEKEIKSLGDLMIGKVQPGDHPVKLFISTGVALEDLTTARLIYERTSFNVTKKGK